MKFSILRASLLLGLTITAAGVAEIVLMTDAQAQIRGRGGAPRTASRPGGMGGGTRNIDVRRPGAGGGDTRDININNINNIHNNIVSCPGCGGSGTRDIDIHHDWDYHPVVRAAAVTAAVVTTAAVIGSIVYSLPPDCVTIIEVNVAYRQCGTVWYQPRYYGSSVQYVVVNPP